MNKNVLCFVGLLLTLPLLVGCPGGGADGMQKVTGSVTYNGEPIEDGRVQFRQVDGDQRSFSGMIENGKYTIETATGSMLVEVRASKLIPGKFDESNPDEKAPMGKMYIPEKYNSRTELTANVTAGSGPIDFTLTGPPAPAGAE